MSDSPWRLLKLVAALPLLAMSGCGSVSDPSAAVPADLLIDHATVLSGRGDAPLEGMRVAVKDGMITAIEPSPGTAPGGARVIDAKGRYLLPGFIDMHAHLLFPRCDPGSAGVRFDRALSERALAATLESGVTFVRSPATPTVEGLALRDDLNAGRVPGPRAMASAELLNDPRMDDVAVKAYVRNALVNKPDYFKAYSRLNPVQIRALADAAHEAGVPLIGHLQRTSWSEGIELGVDHLVHAVDWSPSSIPPEKQAAYRAAIDGSSGFHYRIAWLEMFEPDSDGMQELVRELAEREVSVDVTLIAYASKFSPERQAEYGKSEELDRFPELHEDWTTCGTGAEDWSPQEFARWKAAWPKLQRWVRAMADGGVLLVSGTDVTNPWIVPGGALQDEFALLSEAGLSNAQILRMTGANAAKALEREDIGVIEAGRRADFVLLAADPLEDIANTRNVVWVMQGGKIVAGDDK